MENQEGTKKKFYKRWWFWVGAVVFLFIIIGVSGGSSKPSVSVPAPSESGSTVAAQEKKAATSAPAPTASAPQVLLDLSGSGTKSTQKFTAAGDWDLNWSYDCSNFGYKGNFQVFVYNGDGSMSLNNTGVNQLGMSDSGVEHYHSGGTFYFTVNSECSWKMQVKG
jgi:hypothetical protein